MPFTSKNIVLNNPPDPLPP